MARVEIFIPCYNAEKYIAEALDSIEKQTYQDFSVLIVNDASTDHSVEIIEEYRRTDPRIRLVHNEKNSGECYTRNRAIAECTADYIAFLDADDQMPPDRLEKEMEYLLAHPDCDVVSGGKTMMTEDGRLGEVVCHGELDSQTICETLLFRNCINIGASIFKKSFVTEHQVTFDVDFKSLGDYNFWVDCAIAGADFHVLHESMQYYRVVPTGLSQLHSMPDKLKRRNECFDLIHQKMLKHYGITLNEKEAKVFFKYTTETPKTRGERILDFPAFCKVYQKVKHLCGSKEFKKEFFGI
ncbi:MAG: glycosyltransferase family 2 protein [Agathobacter sp.]